MSNAGALKNHRDHCTVCKSPRLKEIEESYRSGATAVECGQVFGFEPGVAQNHMAVMGLRKARLDDTLGCVQRVIDRGLENLSIRRQDVSPDTLIRACSLQGEIKGQIRKREDKSDPLVIILQALPADTRSRLMEVVTSHNRIEGVIEGGDD